MPFHSCHPTLSILAAMLLTFVHVVPYIGGERVSPQANQSIGDIVEECFPTTNDNFRISVNVTRFSTGDEFAVHCERGCIDLCSSAQAVSLMCDTRESPTCRCKCPHDRTLRTDRLACVDNLSECNFPIFHFDVLSSSGISVDVGASVVSSYELRCRVVGVEDIGDIEGAAISIVHTFRVSVEDHSRINISLPSSDDLLKLQGRLLKLEIKCQQQRSPICIGVKFSGTLTHSISFYLPNRLPSAMTHDPYSYTQELQTFTELQTTIGPTPKSAEEEQLETIITGLCISVAVLMVMWLTCFLVEKKVQRKSSRTATISTPTSSSRMYTYEVSSVRRTLMEMFDMPMIKIHSTEDNESRMRPSSVSSDKSESNEQETAKSDSEDFNGGSADVFTRHERSGYSTSSSDDLKDAPSDKSALLDVPKHKPVVSHDDFAHWIPRGHHPPEGNRHDSPTKKENSPKNSPKRMKMAAKRLLEHHHHGSPAKPIKLHPPILKSALKSSNRKKHAAVRVTMEDEVVFTRPTRGEDHSNNNYIEMDSKEKLGRGETNNVRESANLPHQKCTKL